VTEVLSGAESGGADSENQAGRALADALAAERLRIVATLIRTTGDWDLAEDAVADAVERALQRWPHDGVPDNPAAWLTTTARRRAIDLIRRADAERSRLAEIHALEERRGAGRPTDRGSDPTIYTQALQFDSAADALAASATYRGWLDTCTATTSPVRAPGGRCPPADRLAPPATHQRVQQVAVKPADGERVGLSMPSIAGV
jgi:DNA-directed RNA polymerase specialized sigma24 family protein